MILTLVALLVSSLMYGQTGTAVRGVVKDAAGEPLVGAVVALEGSTSVVSVTEVSIAFLRGNLLIHFFLPVCLRSSKKKSRLIPSS